MKIFERAIHFPNGRSLFFIENDEEGMMAAYATMTTSTGRKRLVKWWQRHPMDTRSPYGAFLAPALLLTEEMIYDANEAHLVPTILVGNWGFMMFFCSSPIGLGEEREEIRLEMMKQIRFMALEMMRIIYNPEPQDMPAETYKDLLLWMLRLYRSLFAFGF